MVKSLATADNPGLKVEQFRPSDCVWVSHMVKLSGSEA